MGWVPDMVTLRMPTSKADDAWLVFRSLGRWRKGRISFGSSTATTIKLMTRHKSNADASDDESSWFTTSPTATSNDSAYNNNDDDDDTYYDIDQDNQQIQSERRRSWEEHDEENEYNDDISVVDDDPIDDTLLLDTMSDTSEDGQRPSATKAISAQSSTITIGASDPDADAVQGAERVLEEVQAWISAVEKALRGLEKKRSSLRVELEKANQLEATTTRAQLLTTYLYMFTDPTVKRVRVPDWESPIEGAEMEICVDPAYSSAMEEANALYAQARKLKRGSQVVQSLLAETEPINELLQEARMDLQAMLRDVSSSTTPSSEGHFWRKDSLQLVKDRLVRSASRTGLSIPPLLDPTTKDESHSTIRSFATSRGITKPGTPGSNLRKLLTPAGTIVYVGRNRRGNDHLTFQVARGNDVWMHARGCPGAHVLLLQRRGSPPLTEECWQFGANLAAFYSDNRNERKVPVVTAQPKHLLRPRRNAPLGSVRIREENRILIGDPTMVPIELVQARRESDSSSTPSMEYYRITDKAKLRKRNQKAIMEAAQKRKQQQQQRRKQEQRKKSHNNPETDD